MGVLDRIDSPQDLKDLSAAECIDLAGEIRAFLVEKVAATGGHLGPNLGVVELTLAIHRIFDSPRTRSSSTPAISPTCTRSLTGRTDLFDTLRKQGGLSGYPSRAESEHDWVESSHASASLSYADGLAKAFALKGERSARRRRGRRRRAHRRNVLGGAQQHRRRQDRSLVIVVNDNGRSYAPTIGGLADHLAALRLQPGYEKLLDTAAAVRPGLPWSGAPPMRCCTA